MELSVIILNYNVRYFLELCLHSVFRALEGMDSEDSEVIVIDNASSDKSCEMVERLFPKVRLIKNKTNIGFARGNNQAADLSNGEWLCILNPDTIVPENIFKNILKYSIAAKNLGALGVKLIDGAGKFLPESKRNVPTTKVSFQKLLGNSQSYYANHIHENSKAEVEILVGAFMFLKKSVYEEVGGFDEDYFMYAEDVDLSYKLLNAGFKNFYLGTEAVIHFKGESTTKDSKYLKRFYSSMQIFYKKHFRKNLFYDFAIWTGVRIIPLYKTFQPLKEINTTKSVLISRSRNHEFHKYYPTPITVFSEIPSIEKDTTYIFDISSNRFLDIIGSISKGSKFQDINFRFYVPGSKYILGSDNSNDRGQLILLKD